MIAQSGEVCDVQGLPDASIEVFTRRIDPTVLEAVIHRFLSGAAGRQIHDPRIVDPTHEIETCVELRWSVHCTDDRWIAVHCER